MNGEPVVGRLRILVGVPGVGKTHWARDLETHDLGPTVISTDDIRREVGGGTLEKFWRANRSGAPDGSQDLVFALFHARVWEACDPTLARDVIADATNLLPRAREQLREIAEHRGRFVECVLFTDLIGAVKRNAERQRQEADDAVSDEIMTRMLGQYHEASGAIPLEPWWVISQITPESPGAP